MTLVAVGATDDPDALLLVVLTTEESTFFAFRTRIYDRLSGVPVELVVINPVPVLGCAPWNSTSRRCGPGVSCEAWKKTWLKRMGVLMVATLLRVKLTGAPPSIVYVPVDAPRARLLLYVPIQAIELPGPIKLTTRSEERNKAILTEKVK